MNRKQMLIGVIILIISLVIGIQYSGILKPASIVGISTVTEEDGITYYYVNVAEYTHTAQEIRTYTLPTSPVEGTDSLGREVEGTLAATFSIKQGNFVGWQTPMAIRDAGPWVSSVWAEKALVGRAIYSTTTPNYLYYQPSSGALILNDYVATVVIDGKTFSKPIVSHANKGLQIIPGTNPPIYWEETLFGLSSSGTLPGLSPSHDIVEHSSGSVYIAQQGSVPKIVKIWNALFEDETAILALLANQGNLIDGTSWGGDIAMNINKRIDLDNDNSYDIEVSDGKKSFTNTNVISNTYKYRIFDMWPLTPSAWYNFPDFNSAVLKSSISTANMKMIHTSTAKPGYPNAVAESSKLIMAGRWKIPIDYGDIRIKTFLPKPVIVSTTWGSTSAINPDGVDDLKVVVKNVGDAGKINVWILSTDSTSLLQLPTEQEIYLEVGQSGTLTFTFKGQGSIITETNAHLRVFAQGGTTTVTKDIVKAVAPINLGTTKYNVKITASTKDYIPLGNDFPVIIGQTGEKSYGVWIGELTAGNVFIKGEEVIVSGKTFYPQNREITVTGDSEFYLIYTTSPPGDDDDEPNYLLWGAIIASLIIAGASYVYYNKRENQ